MARESIKCCPFCGGHRVELNRTNPRACWVSCLKCNAQTDCRKTRNAAIAAWNRRESDDRPAYIIFGDERPKDRMPF